MPSILVIHFGLLGGSYRTSTEVCDYLSSKFSSLHCAAAAQAQPSITNAELLKTFAFVGGNLMKITQREVPSFLFKIRPDTLCAELIWFGWLINLVNQTTAGKGHLSLRVCLCWVNYCSTCLLAHR